MTAPTFIQEAETAWNTNTTPKTTASFNVLAGDILIAFGTISDHNSTMGTPTGGSLTWANPQTVSVAAFCVTYLWTAVVDTNKSMTVSFTRASGTDLFGGNVLTFRGSNGVGASNKTNVASGAPTLNLLTTQANSAIVVHSADWTGADGASRTWRTVNGITPTSGNGLEVSYFRDSSFYTIYGAYYNDVGAIGTYAVGESAPGAQKYSIVAVEVKGTAAAVVATQADRRVLNKMMRGLGR